MSVQRLVPLDLKKALAGSSRRLLFSAQTYLQKRIQYMYFTSALGIFLCSSLGQLLLQHLVARCAALWKQ